MSIRAMTADEIRAALRHGADVCIERETFFWGSRDVLAKDRAAEVARAWWDSDQYSGIDPEQAATFLLLVAEAM